MKGVKVLIVLCGTALLIAGCAVPLGEDYLINRDGSDVTYINDYNLQSYVPIPRPGDLPVTLVNNRGDLEASVVWKDNVGTEIPLPFDSFLAGTVYQAEIKLRANPGYGFYPSIPFSYAEGKITSQTDDLGEAERIVRVIYNNSDDADITFIANYNLQNYVPIPAAGEVWSEPNREDVTVEAAWGKKDAVNGFDPLPAGSVTFEEGAVYQADIRLKANAGYRFLTTKSFNYPAGTVTTPPLSNTDSEDRVLSVVEYKATMTPVVIDDLNLTPYIPKPISGTMPLSSFAGFQYTGTITWKITGTQTVPAGLFQADTEYAAEVSLVPAIGYTLRGLGQNVFTHTGAGTVTNSPDSGAIHIGFSATAKAGSPTVVYDTTLTGYISGPIEEVTPVRVITGSQYSGTVTWTPSHGTFQKDTVYRAELALKAAAGYTFAGIGQNVFIHRDAPGAVTNLGGSGTVTITFPPSASSANPAMTFGPVGTEGSALWMLKERRDYIYPFAIDLPVGSEDIFDGVTLVASDTSPREVIINGCGRILNVKPGAVLTVGGGVTLTLRNITFRGIAGNTTPLFKVWAGGKLILEEGATFVDNKTAGDVGGVWVNGGVLILNEGAEIKGMEARRGGGTLIDGNGKFYMYGGTIGGELSADGNTASGENGGGGVLVANGIFNMYGGTIRSNEAAYAHSGGGVCVLDGGTFNQNAGSIKGNSARESNSGGGVGIIGSTANFVMNNTAVIEENSAREVNSGGGLYLDLARGTFTINNGTIKKNTAHGTDSGGGLYIAGRGDTGSPYGTRNFAMNRGIIVENTAMADNSGGGMYIAGAIVIINAGNIKGNMSHRSDSGGGVFVYDGSLILETPAVVENNIAKDANSGGGLYINGLCDNRGVIKNNIAEGKQSGGGVYLTQNIVYRTDVYNTGTIKGNKALYSSGNAADSGSGGGVYVNESSFMNGGTIGGTDPADANTAVIGGNGVYCAGGRFTLGNYGRITGNTGGGNNYGVYIKNVSFETFMIRNGSATDAPETLPRVTPDNLVFLSPGATISLSSPYGSPGLAAVLANITCDDPISYQTDPGQATKFLSSDKYSAATNINMCKAHFLFNGGSVLITDAKADGSYSYGYYNDP